MISIYKNTYTVGKKITNYEHVASKHMVDKKCVFFNQKIGFFYLNQIFFIFMTFFDLMCRGDHLTLVIFNRCFSITFLCCVSSNTATRTSRTFVKNFLELMQYTFRQISS